MLSVTQKPEQSRAQDAVADQVFDAVLGCVENCGWDKVTMDDICAAAGLSRATLYRLFPGGREVLFEAVRVRELENFFTTIRAHVEGSESLEDLLVNCIVVSATELAHDQHLAQMLAADPGNVGELTVSGLARIIRVATAFVAPLTDSFIPRRDAEALVDVMVRLVISCYLAPSQSFDFTNKDSARLFVRTFLLATVNH